MAVNAAVTRAITVGGYQVRIRTPPVQQPQQAPGPPGLTIQAQHQVEPSGADHPDCHVGPRVPALWHCGARGHVRGLSLLASRVQASTLAAPGRHSVHDMDPPAERNTRSCAWRSTHRCRYAQGSDLWHAHWDGYRSCGSTGRSREVGTSMTQLLSRPCELPLPTRPCTAS